MGIQLFSGNGTPKRKPVALQQFDQLFSQNKRVRILNRKEPFTLRESQKWLPIADSFEYREEYDHE